MAPLESEPLPVRIVTILVLVYVTMFVFGIALDVLGTSLHPLVALVVSVVVVIGGLRVYDQHHPDDAGDR